MIVLIVLICTLLLCTYKYGTRNFDYWKLRGVPYIKPKFFFGIIYDVILKQELIGIYLAQFYNTFRGPCYGFYAFNVPFLVLTEPDMITNVFITNFQKFTDRCLVNNERIDSVITYGLFGAKEPYWRPTRLKLTPFFTLSKVKSMFVLLKDCAANFSMFLHDSVGCNVDIKDATTRFATDALARCIFGATVNSFGSDDTGFPSNTKMMFSTTTLRTASLLCYYYCHFLVRLFKLKFVKTSTRRFIGELFTESLNYREATKVKGNDMVDCFVQLNNEIGDSKLSFDALAAQAILFQVAGSESVASTMAFTFHELCLNQKMQDKLRSEMQLVITKYSRFTYQAVQDMNYLHMVVSETLRKYPAAPLLHRKCIEDHKVPNMNLIIEKGTNISISSFGLHRNPKYFPDPEKYDPERFNDNNKNNIKPGTYVPFGSGPRACIAEVFAMMIVKRGIVEVLTKYRVVKNEKTMDPVVFTMSPVLVQTKYSLNMTIQKLN